jgi:N12 class adenine-specific DNA methylase
LNSRNFRLKGVLDRPADTGFMPKSRYRDNVHALRTLHELKFSGEDPDDEQRHALARYVGWGGLSEAVGHGYTREWHQERTELSQMMEEGVFTRQDRQVFSESALNAHYTAPEVVESVWRALEHMGFKQGDVLEPAVGTGNFIGLMPDSLLATTRMTGVEQEPISAAIAKRLYPDAHITRSPFEEYPIQDGSFDAVVGNIPFGNYQLHDPKYDKHRLSIHNYFLVRALDALRENGITAIITSCYTMDSKDSRARALMAERGELAGAIRLPNTAFQKNAGTRVGTDILFFRKWTAAEIQQGLNDPEKTSWVKLDPVKDNKWNPYFNAHPEKVIGERELVSTQFGYREEAVLKNTEELPALLDAAIATLPKNVIKPRVIGAGESVEDLRKQVSFASVSADDYRPGMYILEVPEDGNEDSPQVMVVDRVDTDPESGEKTVVADITDVAGKRLERLIGMIQLRDTAQELIAEQGRNEDDTPAMADLQAKLNTLYDAFVEQHGPVNSKANSRVFSDDPLCGVVLALEDYNAEQDTATKRPIFTSRVLKPSKMPESADTPLEALMISLSYLGRPSRPLIMELLEYEDTDEQWQQVRDVLGDRIFFDPGARQYQSSDLYLSGNVREKLALAKRFEGFDPAEMGRNIAALEAIQPKDLTPGDIFVQIGAPWIPLEDHRQFLMALLDIGSWESDALQLEHVAEADAWSVKLGGRVKDGYSTKQARTVEWGTTKVPAEKLFEHALKRTLPTVNYPKSSPDDPTIIDKDSTLAARAKLSAIKSKFQTWIWEDPDRSERLLKAYNKRFNSFVAMQPNGSHLTFPGMNPLIKLRPHQKDAIWRTVTTGNVLYAHEVGTGKTFTMIGALMEMKRLGRSQRPFMVVKRNTLKQMESAARLLYPGARIQVMDSENMSAKNRRRFLSQFLVNEFDIAIMSYEAFEKIPLSPEEQAAFLNEEKDRLAATLFAMKANSVDKKPSFSEKAISKRLKTLETKLKRLVNREAKDEAIFFDEIKPDTLCFDESHTLKNLNVESKDSGFNSDGSQRAQDAYSKIAWLYRQHGADQNLIMASGTPISNTFAEGFTLMRYAMPERFEAMMGGQPHFDRFASIFIKPETTIEIGVDGHYKERSRYSIVNIPELMGAMDFMDVRYADDLGIERPHIQRTILTTPANEVQEVFRLEIAQRAEAIKNRSVEPDEDNYLKLASDGRKAALDIRLLDPELPDFPDSKINTVIGEIVKRYEQSSDVLGTQAVFCDQGVPGGASFDLYNDMKTKLINQGIPADQIAFAHDANTDAQREQLFERINRGEIRVIIGSTEKMGTGTNMQERMVALYHLDAPSNMRPSDVEQREGRINRQGNINKEAEILTVVTADSFDLFVWQIMRFKQHMIQQVMRNDAGVRELNEDDEGASYDAIMAAATGSTLIKDKIQIDRDVDHYTALQREHANQQHRIRRETKDLRKEIEENETRIALLSAIHEHQNTWIDTQRELYADFEATNRSEESEDDSPGLTFDLDSGDMTSDEKVASDRPLPPEKLCGLEYEGRPIPEKERTKFVKGLREQALSDMNVMSNRHVVEGLTYYGIPLKVEFLLSDDPNKPMSERLSLKPEGQVHSLSTNGFAKMKEHMGNIDTMIHNINASMARDRQELEQLLSTADQPFEHEGTLVELLSQQMEMNEKVAEEARQFQESIKDSAGITTIAAWKEAHVTEGLDVGRFTMELEVNLDSQPERGQALTY